MISFTKSLKAFVTKIAGTIWFQFVIMLVFCLIILKTNEAGLFFGYDGIYARELTKFNFDWCLPNISISFNPLQGMGGINHAVNFWLSIPSIFTFCLGKMTPDPVLLYTFTTLELFASVWILAKALKMNSGVAIGASWAAAIFCLPFIIPMNSQIGGFYGISGLLPYIIEEMSIGALLLALILNIQQGEVRNIKLRLLMLVGLIVLLIAQFPIHFTLIAPLIFCFILFGCVQVTKDGRHLPLLLRFAITATVILIFPLTYAAGMGLWSVAALFSAELENTYAGHPAWEYISILSHGFLNMGWASTLVYCLGYAGSALALWRGPRPLNHVAIVYLTYSTSLLIFGTLTTFVFTSYRGPQALYFEWYLWPLMFVFAAYFARSLADLLISSTSFFSTEARALFSKFARWIPGSVTVPVILASVVLVLNNPKATGDFPKPPARTALIEFLQEKVGLFPGSQWRGSVANFCAARTADRVIGWPHERLYDTSLWTSAGNDHRAVGFWWYNIPTLFSYNTNLSPSYYYLMSRFFASRADSQVRSLVVISKPDPKLLGLVGVRYFLTDHELPGDDKSSLVGAFDWMLSQGAQQMKFSQILYEVKNPNLRGFSPTRPVFRASADEAVSELLNDRFDPSEEVVVHEPLSHLVTKARQSSFIWEKGGAKITAEADGWSLLVLPLEYSNCLRILGNDASSRENTPQLVRVNVALTGVLFEKHLDATIRQSFGPFSNVFARMVDYTEFKRLVGVSQAH